MASPIPWRVIEHNSGEFCPMIVASDGSTVVRAVEKKDDAMLIVASVNDSTRLIDQYVKRIVEENKRLRHENSYLRGIEHGAEQLAVELHESRKKLEELQTK